VHCEGAVLTVLCVTILTICPAMSLKRPFYVEKRYHVAKFDECLICPSERPSLFTLRGLRSSVFYYTWRQAVGFICIYYIIQFIYRYEIRPYEQVETKFHDMVEIWNSEIKVASKDLIFLLGFYVSMIVKRWWDQVYNLPEIDQIAVLMGGLVVTDGKNDEEAHNFKILVLRYCLLSYCLVMRKISKGMRKEYWSTETLIDKGLITKKEAEHMDRDREVEVLSLKWFVPLAWAVDRIKQSKFGSQVLIPVEHKQLFAAVKSFQHQLQRVHCYCEYPIPTVYKQVVIFAVGSFFTLAVIAEQELIYDPEENAESPNFGFPIFLVLKFIFIAGWLCVAETIRNPFGEDEEDINVIKCLDHNIWVASVAIEQQDNVPQQYLVNIKV